jgi:hypothetical protein
MTDWREELPDGLSDDHRRNITACVDLVGRTGARRFEIGYLNDDPPQAWYAHAQFRGARIQVENHDSCPAAATALAEKILTGAKCRCGRLVALRSGTAFAFPETPLADGTTWTAEQAAAAGQCRWRLVGERWEPSCPEPADADRPKVRR